MMKKQNGITLIALVITIIVLLILAGVSIAMLTGDNGILTKAKTAKNSSAEAEVIEAVKLGIGEITADKLDTVTPQASKGTSGILTAKEIAKAAKRNNASISETAGKENTDTEITDKTSIFLTLDNVNYEVEFTPAKDGNPAVINIAQ